MGVVFSTYRARVAGLLRISEVIFIFLNMKEMSNGRSKNQQLLLDIVRDEVVLRLEQSLHNRIYIITDKEEDPSQVKPPWAIDIQIGAQPKFQLPPDTKITNIYDREDIKGRLLITGAPGSGKTTTLLELAQDLIDRAKENSEQPIPILLNLSSWTEEYQSLKNWIVSDLNFKYKVRKDISSQWLNQDIVIPFLDGLDELEPARQEKCVEQINEFLQLKLNSSDNRSSSLVVCSRTEEYSYLATQLILNGSIVLQPFTHNQICNYVLRTKGEQFWNNLNNDQDLMELAKTPLFLNILTLSFQENYSVFQDLQSLNSSQERLSYIFDNYINTMLNRNYNKLKPDNEKAKYWLAWLATQLKQKNRTEFFIENLSPSWLITTEQQLIYQILICTILAMVFGINGIVGGLVFCLSLGFTEQSINIKIARNARNFINKFFLINRLYVIAGSFLINLIIPIPNPESYIIVPPKLILMLPPIIKIKKSQDIEIQTKTILIKEPKEDCEYYNTVGYFSKLNVFNKPNNNLEKIKLNNYLFCGCIGFICNLLFFYAVQNLTNSNNSENFIFIAQRFWEGISGFIGGFLVGFSTEFIQNIKIFENLKFSVSLSFQKGMFFTSILIANIIFITFAAFGTIFLPPILLSGILQSDVSFIVPTDNVRIYTMLFSILFTTFFFGLIGFIICGFTSSEIEFKTRANQGIYKSLLNATIIGITLAIVSGIINGLFYGFVYQLSFNKSLLLGTIIGFFHGLMGGLLSGGISCLQHFTLRLILWLDGYIPWNYANFLDYSTNRLFLQKVGGGYRFVHRLLQDHFAQIQIGRN